MQGQFESQYDGTVLVLSLLIFSLLDHFHQLSSAKRMLFLVFCNPFAYKYPLMTPPHFSPIELVLVIPSVSDDRSQSAEYFTLDTGVPPERMIITLLSLTVFFFREDLRG